MGQHATLLNCLLTPGDAFQYPYPVLEAFKGPYINQIRGGLAVFRDQYRRAFFLKLRQNLRSLSL